MPPKRKKRMQTKSKTEGSSSSESEYSRTLEIITRLSQKYLSTNDKAKKPTTSTEFGYDGDEENSTDASAQSQSTNSSSSSNMYDFDEPDYFSSMDTSVTSPKLSLKKTDKKAKKPKMKSDSKNEYDNKMLKKSKSSSKSSKSPLKSSNKNKKTEPSKAAKSSFSDLKKNKLNSSATPSSAASKSVSFSPSSSVVFSNSPVVSLQRLDLSNVEGYESFQRPLRKRKGETVDNPESNAKSKKVQKCDQKSSLQGATKRRTSKRRDSGVIMSPPSCNKNKIPMLSPTGTSTPSNENNVKAKMNFKKSKTVHSTEKQTRHKAVVSSTPAGIVGRPTKQRSVQRSDVLSRSTKRDMNNSNFGFDSIETPSRSIDVSPVSAGIPITPTSDYASMSLGTPSMQLSFDVDDHLKRKSVDDSFVPELFSEDIVLNKSIDKTYKSQKPLKKKRKAEKKVNYTPKIDKIAERLNDEFEEIEKFQLSIEDM